MSKNAVPTLRARAQLVLVDVVVLDRNHQPVRGLTKADFSLSEGGLPQTVRSFEEHSSAKLPAPAPLPAMPAGTFTNYQPVPAGSSANVLLVDSLNTPIRDQPYLREQLLKYLSSAKPGTNLAIFSLTRKISLLQGFTTDPEILRAAVARTRAKSSPLLDDHLTDITYDDNAGLSFDALSAASGMKDLTTDSTAFATELRARYTLDGLDALARYLANIPGRKNLIWFSGSFPVDVLPDAAAANPYLSVQATAQQYRDTINQLTRSQVAVYPVDARGLQPPPMFQAGHGGKQYVTGDPSVMSNDLDSFYGSLNDEHETMRHMATDTGGEAFVNTNGFAQTISRVVETGSQYYTLAYTPTNAKWAGEYRNIDVKLAQPGYTLAYRRGYYADDPNSVHSALAAASTEKTSQSSALRAGMLHGMPSATQIVYSVKAVSAGAAPEDKAVASNVLGLKSFAPAKGPFTRYSVDYAADPHDLRLVQGADQHFHGALEFVALLYAADGRPAVVQRDSVDADLTPEAYAAALKQGLHFHQDISVPAKGAFTMRTGIHDRNTDRFGAVEFMLKPDGKALAANTR